MPKGGMCKNPFAGNNSLNNLDDEFMASLFKGELSVDQALSLRIIKMSVRDYLFFGLGKNGITPERFLEAFEYLFKVRASRAETWGDVNTNERYRDLDGSMQSVDSTLSNQEVKAKCFDTHFDTAGLSNRMSLGAFTTRLRQKREAILNANLQQVLSYMDKYRNFEWKALPKALRKGKQDFPRVDVVRTLTTPQTGREVAQLYCFGRDIRPADTDSSATARAFKGLKYRKLLF